MFLQILIFFLIYQCTAQPAGSETSVHHAVWPRQEPTTQGPQTLPNPYQIPTTPISLDFNATTGPGLDRADTLHTFYRFQAIAQEQMIEVGDTPILPKVWRRVHGVRLEVTRRRSELGGYILTWNTALQAVSGVGMKMHIEGFKARTCDVHYLVGAKDVVVGTVKVGPVKVGPSGP